MRYERTCDISPVISKSASTPLNTLPPEPAQTATDFIGLRTSGWGSASWMKSKPKCSLIILIARPVSRGSESLAIRPIPAPSKDSRGSEGMIGSWEMERGMKGLINLLSRLAVVQSSIDIIHRSPGVDTVGRRIETGVRGKDRDTLCRQLEK